MQGKRGHDIVKELENRVLPIHAVLVQSLKPHLGTYAHKNTCGCTCIHCTGSRRYNLLLAGI